MRLLIFFILFTLALSTEFFIEEDGEIGCDCACDIDKGKLGRSTWHLLHEIAEHVESDDTTEPSFRVFMHALSMIYPCEECREHIKEYLSNRRVELSEKWVCEFHNEVNERLNKTIYEC